MQRRLHGGGVLTRRQLPLHQLRWFPSPSYDGEELSRLMLHRRIANRVGA